MPKRRQKGSGGLYRRHDAPDCPPLVVIGYDDEGKPIKGRAEHKCRGRWVGTVEVTIDGERRRKVVYGRTEKEARIKQRAAMQDKDAGNLVLDTMTVEAWFTYWLDHILKGRIRAKTFKVQTLKGYRSHVRNHIIPAIGRKRLTDVRPAHIRALYDGMRERELAEATVRQVHAILRKSLKDAMRDGKLANNPTDRVDPPGTQTNDRERLALEDARLVLDAAEDDARWWLAVFYGMRQGECLGLRWCDVDFDHHILTVNQTLQLDEDNRVFFDRPKSKASRRVIPLMPRMEARLKLHAARVGGHTPEDLVFSRSGKPIQPKRDWSDWSELLEKAGTPHVALHAARNTAASLLEAAGVPDRLVAQILGHSQVHITHGYQTADDARVRAALSAYEGLLELG